MGVGVGVGLQAPSALGSQGVGCGDGWRVAQSSLGFREGDDVGSRVSPPPPSDVGAGVSAAAPSGAGPNFFPYPGIHTPLRTPSPGEASMARRGGLDVTNVGIWEDPTRDFYAVGSPSDSAQSGERPLSPTQSSL